MLSLAAACDEGVTTTAMDHLPDVFSITAHPGRNKSPSGSSLKHFAEKPRKKPVGDRAGKLIQHSFFVVLQFFNLLHTAPSSLGT